jgi:hypothetical protein
MLVRGPPYGRLSVAFVLLLSLPFGQRVVTLVSPPGPELGLTLSPVLVLMLAQTAVAALRSACCDSWITTGT